MTNKKPIRCMCCDGLGKQYEDRLKEEISRLQAENNKMREIIDKSVYIPPESMRKLIKKLKK